MSAVAELSRADGVEYIELVPGLLHFRCDALNGTMSTANCVGRAAIAERDKAIGRYSACLLCPIGMVHSGKAHPLSIVREAAAAAGATRDVVATADRPAVCPRCARGGFRIIHSAGVCVSCYTPTEIRAAPRTIAYLHERADQFKEMQRAAAEMAREAERKRQEKAEARQAERPQSNGRDQSRATAGGRIHGGFGSQDGDGFWRNVNARALANLSAWVPVLFPQAVWQAGTSGYRVSQRDLGEAYQEDLSIHPDGIVDFGVADMGDSRDGKRAPIDLVQEHGGAGNAADAAQWLCDRLGIDPESLGWRGRKARSGASQRGRGDSQAAGDPQSDGDADLPVVQVVGGEIPRVVREAEAVILEAGSAIYSRAGSLVRPVIEEAPASGGRTTTVARFRSLCVASLADHTARVMRFQRFDGRVKDWVTINPPSEVMTAMLTREGEWSLPPVGRHHHHADAAA